MSRILRRPMFRGGRVSSYGTGIASGLADGGRVGYKDAGIVDIYESVKERIPERNTQGLSRGDYLRIASAGLDILGAPGETGGILGGTLSAASKPLSKLGVDLGTSMDARQQAELDRREELARTLTGAEVEYKVGMEKAKGETGRRQILLESITETKRENVRNDKSLSEEEKTNKLNQIQAKYNSDLEFYVFQGGDVSDFFKLGSQSEIVKSAASPENPLGQLRLTPKPPQPHKNPLETPTARHPTSPHRRLFKKRGSQRSHRIKLFSIDHASKWRHSHGR